MKKESAAKKPEPSRTRPHFMVTLDKKVVREAKAVGAKQIPKITSLSRLVDLALAQWTQRNRK